jgi:hypothetical protein
MLIDTKGRAGKKKAKVEPIIEIVYRSPESIPTQTQIASWNRFWDSFAIMALSDHVDAETED